MCLIRAFLSPSSWLVHFQYNDAKSLTLFIVVFAKKFSLYYDVGVKMMYLLLVTEKLYLTSQILPHNDGEVSLCI